MTDKAAALHRRLDAVAEGIRELRAPFIREEKLKAQARAEVLRARQMENVNHFPELLPEFPRTES